MECGHPEVARFLLEEHRNRGAPGPLRANGAAMTPDFVVTDEDSLRPRSDAGTGS